MATSSTTSTWWQRPVLRNDEANHIERRANWMELFFDLVFVVAVAELAHGLSENQTWGGVLSFLLLFVPIFWVWNSHVYYTDRFETRDFSYRFFTFLLLVGVASLGFHVHDGIGESSVGFALSYAYCRILIIGLWYRAGYHNPEARGLTTRYGIGYLISAALWILSVFVPEPARYYLWTIGVVIDLITPLTTFGEQRKLPPLTNSHLPERFGIFTILVLREPIFGVIDGISDATHQLTLEYAVLGILGLLLAFLLWIMYFDEVSDHRIRQRIWTRYFWSYLHLPLILGIAGLGAGILNAYHHIHEPLTSPVSWLICGGIAVTIICIALIELSEDTPSTGLTRLKRLDIVQIVAAVAIFLLGAVAQSLQPLAFFLILAGLMLVPVIAARLMPAEMDAPAVERDGEPHETSELDADGGAPA
jgi:low temperature requirement protein LtrA